MDMTRIDLWAGLCVTASHRFLTDCMNSNSLMQSVVNRPALSAICAATTATVQDEVFEWMINNAGNRRYGLLRHGMTIRFTLNPLQKVFGQPPKAISLISPHDVVSAVFRNAILYRVILEYCQCIKTARLLRDELKWPDDEFKVSFQSRFGREPWLQLYTDETIEQLAHDGVGHLAIVAPGFSADCLETLEELNMEGREEFIENGGKTFYIPLPE